MANVGDDAILFSEPDYLTGNTFTLADHAREVVSLAFEALEWCAYCQIEAPVIQQLWVEYQANTYQPKVQFVMIHDTLDEQGLAQILEEYGITMPVIDEFDIIAHYQVFLYPTVIIIKPGLKICSIKKGSPGTELEIRNDIIQRIFDCSTETSLPERGAVIAAGNAVTLLMEKYRLGKSAKIIFSRERINIQYGNESHSMARSELTAAASPMDSRDKKSYKMMVREVVNLLKPKKELIEEWLKRIYPKSYKNDMTLYLGNEMMFHLGVLPLPEEIDLLVDNALAQKVRIPPYIFKWNTDAVNEGRHTLSFRSPRINRSTMVLVTHLG